MTPGSPAVETLRHRADFLRAARAARQSRPAFTLQARQRAGETPDGPQARQRTGETPDGPQARQRAGETPDGPQARQRAGETPDGPGIRVGFTCSRKVGNAVARNRAKRRLRAAARAVLPVVGRAGWDYVLIGRAGLTATQDFAQLCDDLRTAVEAVHRRRPPG